MKEEVWTPQQLAKFLEDHPDATIRLDYERLKEMYPEIDFPDRQKGEGDAND